MSRNLIPRRLDPEIIEPVSSDLIEVTDGSEINLGMEFYADQIACNTKGLDRCEFTLNHPTVQACPGETRAVPKSAAHAK
jgi:hypothetical protein